MLWRRIIKLVPLDRLVRIASVLVWLLTRRIYLRCLLYSIPKLEILYLLEFLYLFYGIYWNFYICSMFKNIKKYAQKYLKTYTKYSKSCSQYLASETNLCLGSIFLIVLIKISPANRVFIESTRKRIKISLPRKCLLNNNMFRYNTQCIDQKVSNHRLENSICDRLHMDEIQLSKFRLPFVARINLLLHSGDAGSPCIRARRP